ncbi:MAG: DUF3313 family protein [Xanthomonadales bacterium]|jgi:hypothetical protein|nr:DUF3313 family protein [Xanthomonadales bacterium]
MSNLLLKKICIGLLLSLITVNAAAKESLPETTKDGLHLKHQDELGAVYTLPGASLSAYQRIKLVDVYVAFEKNYQRDYNREQMGLANRLTDDDMQKIKDKVASEFKRVFTKELEKGGYKVVDETAQDVMILRPAIINLQITAPEIANMTMSRTIVRSTGSMTLYMELYDSVTSQKFAEVIDAEEIGNNSFSHVANRGTNQAELDRTLADWARLLRKRLEEAHEATATSGK